MIDNVVTEKFNTFAEQKASFTKLKGKKQPERRYWQDVCITVKISTENILKDQTNKTPTNQYAKMVTA